MLDIHAMKLVHSISLKKLLCTLFKFLPLTATADKASHYSQLRGFVRAAFIKVGCELHGMTFKKRQSTSTAMLQKEVKNSMHGLDGHADQKLDATRRWTVVDSPVIARFYW